MVTNKRVFSAFHEQLVSSSEKQSGSSNRSFGFVFAIFFLIVALLPLLYGNGIWFWAVGISFIFGVLALAAPSILKPLNYLWFRFGMLLHKITSPAALAIIFFGVVFPIGFFMRLLGKDQLRLKLDKTATSYWIVRTPPGPTAESLKNQF